MFGSVPEDALADGSFDENAFLSEAGIGSGDGFGDGGGAGGAANAEKTRAGANVVETALTAFYRATGIGKLSDFLRDDVAKWYPEEAKQAKDAKEAKKRAKQEALERKRLNQYEILTHEK